MNLELIERILEELDRTDARYFKIENPKNKIEIILKKRKIKGLSKEDLSEVVSDKSKTEKPMSETFDITSPYVGFFQRSEKKEDKPIVKLREVVEKGKIVSYIRSMNLQYEVISEIDGKIVEVLVEDGQAVEFGQPLFRLKPSVNDNDVQEQ